MHRPRERWPSVEVTAYGNLQTWPVRQRRLHEGKIMRIAQRGRQLRPQRFLERLVERFRQPCLPEHPCHVDRLVQRRADLRAALFAVPAVKNTAVQMILQLVRQSNDEHLALSSRKR